MHPRVTRLPESYGECRGRAIVHDAGSTANSFAPVGVTRAAWAMSLNSLERIRRLISWARARCRATRGPSVGETICCDVRGRPEPPESTVNVTVALSILARRRPVPSAREMIVWSRTLAAVARRMERCSSVVRVVGERCGTHTGSLGRGGSQGQDLREHDRGRTQGFGEKARAAR